MAQMWFTPTDWMDTYTYAHNMDVTSSIIKTCSWPAGPKGLWNGDTSWFVCVIQTTHSSYYVQDWFRIFQIILNFDISSDFAAKYMAI